MDAREFFRSFMGFRKPRARNDDDHEHNFDNPFEEMMNEIDAMMSDMDDAMQNLGIGEFSRHTPPSFYQLPPIVGEDIGIPPQSPSDDMLKHPESSVEDESKDLVKQRPKMFSWNDRVFSSSNKKDSDVDTEDSLDSIFGPVNKSKEDMNVLPENAAPKMRGYFQSISSRTVRTPDGKVETHRTVKDSFGKVETTVTTHFQDGRTDTVISGEEPNLITWSNSHSNSSILKHMWNMFGSNTKNNEEPMILPRKRQDDDLDKKKSIFDKLFGD